MTYAKIYIMIEEGNDHVLNVITQWHHPPSEAEQASMIESLAPRRLDHIFYIIEAYAHHIHTTSEQTKCPSIKPKLVS